MATFRPVSSCDHCSLPLKPSISTFPILPGEGLAWIESALMVVSRSGHPMRKAYKVLPFTVKRTSSAVSGLRRFSLVLTSTRAGCEGAFAPEIFQGRVAKTASPFTSIQSVISESIFNSRSSGSPEPGNGMLSSRLPLRLTTSTSISTIVLVDL